MVREVCYETHAIPVYAGVLNIYTGYCTNLPPTKISIFSVLTTVFVEVCIQTAITNKDFPQCSFFSL